MKTQRYSYVYNLLINKRVANKRKNLDKIYFEKTYTNKTNIVKAKTTWFIKKKGTSWGIIIYITYMTFFIGKNE